MFQLLKKIKDKKEKAFVEFLIRTGIFMFLILLTNIFLPNYKELLNQPYYNVNSGFYKFLLFFIIIIFVYTNYKKIRNSYSYKNKTGQTLLFTVFSIIFFSIPFTYLSQNFSIHPIVANYLLSGTAILCLSIAIYNINFLFKYLQEEVLKLFLIILAFLSAPLILKNLWTVLFYPIKISINLISKIIGKEAIISTLTEDTGFIVHIKEFVVAVGPACSGIQSIIAFTILFISASIFLKENKEIIISKFIKYYLIAVIFLYMLNILRIIILIYIGAYISEKMAIDLFHEYFSSIVFLIFFIIYIKKYIKNIFKNGA